LFRIERKKPAMSDEDDKDRPAAPEERRPGEHDALAPSGLPRPLQEHLGQQLRTTYQAMDEKPAFLGDTNVPPELEAPLQRLETRERIRHQGLEAVRSALESDGEPKGRPTTSDRRRSG
jgi:hypothetical protein